MEGENIYEKIQEIFGEAPGTLSILEEKVDIDLQMEYFELSRKIKKSLDEDKIIKEKSGIYNPKLEEEARKRLFIQLASIENVEAYRYIEKYLKDGNEALRNWAVLALQESRMLLESKLLEENQVFISTGLGGKGAKLRYFVVLIRNEGEEFPEIQQKVVRNEFEIYLKEQKAEIEKIDFPGRYATLLVVIPLKVAIKELFTRAIEECNRYGDFLKSNFIVTNVRELNSDEIDEFLARQELSAKQGKEN